MSSLAVDLPTNPIDEESAFLSRAASYNNLSDIPVTEPGSPGLRRTFSDLTFPNNEQASPSKEDVAAGKDILRRTSLRRNKEKSAVAVSRFTLPAEDLNDPATSEPSGATAKPPVKYPETKAPEPVARPSKARSMSGRLVNLARKPWGSSGSQSRSPSPSPKPSKNRYSRSDDQTPSKSQGLPSKSNSRLESVKETDPVMPSRRRTILSKRPRRPMVAVVTQSQDDSPSSSSSPHSLRAKNSLERLAASLHVTTPILPPMPKGAAVTAGNFSGYVDLPRKKDELWGVFRGLEADYQKFHSKSSALKANVIRSSLLPFLNRNQSSASCKSLRAEDLDRRVNILNKWWTGLLEMLNGKNNQSISGTDRPVYLEAVVGIMMRPEWRIPFPMPPNRDEPPNSLHHASTSISESSDSSGSDFLIESIHHNIRNIFVQNLLSQMAFVVERMSMRHAPASLVAFCGKACAYAFFFCPGVADILVRLWNTPASIFRRILADSGVERCRNIRAFTQDLGLNFPIALRTLCFHSHTPLVRYLRQKPDVPLSTAQIQWQSPWVSRWCGRDTDLFFVFVKYIHILYADALPTDIEKPKRILAPGLLPIHAQVLVVMEDTLYKQSSPQMPESTHTAAAITFDDFIEGADATVSALPLGSANSHRSMAENRLIILLRDFLSESSLEPQRARLLYAESFCNIMKAAAQKTSLFDHNACFLLCDFVEEVLPILTRYSQAVDMELFDWKFWLSACRQMMRSHNSLTEVRVFSFLFCVWGMWITSEERKADLCLDFLLDESLFYHYFSHWSPMVRAYFQRLLCWRVCRFNGEPSPLDSTIYETVWNRLQRVWFYYRDFQANAERELKPPLSSAPCSPAPGRRIIIIRCDNHITPPSLFVSFDRVVPPAPTELTVGSKGDDFSESQAAPKRRWNLLKAMFGSSSSIRNNDDASPPSTSSEDSDSRSHDTMNGTEKNSDDHLRPQNGTGESSRPKTPHQPYTFKFSLEWMDRPQWPSKNKRLYGPCLPVGAQLHLQLRGYLDRPVDDASEYASAIDFDEREKTDCRLEDAASDKEIQGPAQDAADGGKTLGLRNTRCLAKDGVVASKYAGRALAEWAQIVTECDSFFARRRDEGVPCDRMVETPMLGVEGFRK
ncbi:hypothetical protein KXV92_000260 [Aspergillus fumigatus]|nr:hypothetical protein KXX42_009301 [Aspergillus fumigatus]KAH1548193.1 hypothetical protein KXX57_001907 [Aspergillus fumigatus]KAH1976065.1 hypothetical protein KXW88_009389 [Aspergillus fumigatus]KAH2665209.1 hypothetical protein KXV32_007364 [Aspergillus fumigatus]KAH2760951.1 hypothetical protein KXV94_007181 [Aspergillus fumigatus]